MVEIVLETIALHLHLKLILCTMYRLYNIFQFYVLNMDYYMYPPF